MSTTTPLVHSAPARAADAIRKFISNTGLAMGAMLPPERKLSQDLGFSYMTIRAANHVLETEGVIRREHGRGTFVASPTWNEARRASRVWHKLIGYIWIGQGEGDDYALREFRVMEQLLSAKGYPMVLGVLHEEDLGRTWPQSFDSLKLDALVIDGFLSRTCLHQLAQRGIPIVVAGNHSAHESFPFVEIDFRELSRLLTKALFDQGMDTVCMICEPLRLDYTRELLEGYRQALSDAKRGIELLGLWQMNDIGRMTESLRRMLARFGPKLGLLGYHNEVGFALNNLAAAGVEVDQCVAVVGADHRVGVTVPHVVFELPVDGIPTETAESMCRLLNGDAVGDKRMRPVLRRLEIGGKVDFAWKVCESKLDDRRVTAVARLSN